MDDDTRTPTGLPGLREGVLATSSGPSPVPLGVLAVLVAVVSAVLAMTYYLSLLAYPGAALALALGALSLHDRRSRAVGIGAVGIAVLAIVGATAMLVSLW